jgi:hypothetical protein
MVPYIICSARGVTKGFYPQPACRVSYAKEKRYSSKLRANDDKALSKKQRVLFANNFL